MKHGVIGRRRLDRCAASDEVHCDPPGTNPTTDQAHICLAVAATNSDGSLGLTGLITVNSDRTATDQWNPAIAVKPGATQLFIGYYSRQNDTNNSLIMAYGAKGDVANGLTNTTFDCFPISTTSFPPLFNGTNSPSNMQFDPVYAPSTSLCYDEYARVVCLPNSQPPFCPTNDVKEAYLSNWFQDDNTWADADTNYFYYAWCDRSATCTNNFSWTWGGSNPWPTNFTGRPAADVKIAIIKQ